MTQKLAILMIFLGASLAGALSKASVAETSSFWQKSVPFYRDQGSPFSSGEASVKTLEKRIIGSEWDLRYDVKWNNKKFVLSESAIALDINFAQYAVITRAFRFQGKEIPADKKVKIEKVDGLWTLIKFEKLAMWVPTDFLSASPEDLGSYRTIRSTALKKQSDSRGKTLAEIPAGTNFLITQWKNDWLQIVWRGTTGYINSHDLIGRADFAEWAFVNGRGWVKVKYRVGSHLQTETKESISLSQVRGFKSFPHRAFITQESKELPPLQSIVEIENRRIDRWNLSLHEEHGPVWWKVEKLETANIDLPAVSFSELVHHNISSFDYTTGAKTKGLISADGIYQSDDGKSWKKIPMFGNQNHPVAIQGDTLFVGSYRSDDGGKTFEPFIHWDRLYSSLQNVFHRQPPVLRIVDLKPAKDSIEMKLDTGIKRVTVRTALDFQSWKVIR